MYPRRRQWSPPHACRDRPSNDYIIRSPLVQRIHSTQVRWVLRKSRPLPLQFPELARGGGVGACVWLTMVALLLLSPFAMVPPTTTTPKVSAPAGFVQPVPQPLSMTRPKEQLPGLLTGGLALAIRLATGVPPRSSNLDLGPSSPRLHLRQVSSRSDGRRGCSREPRPKPSAPSLAPTASRLVRWPFGTRRRCWRMLLGQSSR